MGLRHRELPSRACSSTPSRSSPRPATTCCATSSAAPRADPSGQRRVPVRHRGEAVGHQGRERFGIEIGGTRRAFTQPAQHAPAPLAEAARERSLPCERRSSGSGPRVTHRARERALGARGSRGRHSIAPTSMSASSAVTTAQRTPDLDHRPLGAFAVEPLAAHPLDTRGGCSRRARGRPRRRPARRSHPRCSARPRAARRGRRASRGRR